AAHPPEELVANVVREKTVVRGGLHQRDVLVCRIPPGEQIPPHDEVFEGATRLNLVAKVRDILRGSRRAVAGKPHPPGVRLPVMEERVAPGRDDVTQLDEPERAVRAEQPGGELVAAGWVDPVECVEGDDGVVVVTRRRPLLEVSLDDLDLW